MITGKVAQWDARCKSRGYTLDEVRACIVSEKGDTVTVDVDHPAYPRVPKPGFELPVLPPPAPPNGPGTELRKLLSSIGITATPNCKCNARVKHMDAMEAQEPGWCERNIDTVVGYLREAAADRGLPFLDLPARLLVRRAISNARKEAARATQASNAEGSEAKTR
jgi:hypothetical protein